MDHPVLPQEGPPLPVRTLRHFNSTLVAALQKLREARERAVARIAGTRSMINQMENSVQDLKDKMQQQADTPTRDTWRRKLAKLEKRLGETRENLAKDENAVEAAYTGHHRLEHIAEMLQSAVERNLRGLQ